MVWGLGVPRGRTHTHKQTKTWTQLIPFHHFSGLLGWALALQKYQFAHPCEKSSLSTLNPARASKEIIKCNSPLNVRRRGRGKKRKAIPTSLLTLRGKFHFMLFRGPCDLIISFFTVKCNLRGCVPTHFHLENNFFYSVILLFLGSLVFWYRLLCCLCMSASLRDQTKEYSSCCWNKCFDMWSHLSGLYVASRCGSDWI